MSVSTVDLSRVLAQAVGSGAVWGSESEDLNFNCVAWAAGEGVAEHVNSEVDVLILGLSGRGSLIVDGEEFEILPGVATLVQKGASRAIEARGDDGVAYLTVHKRRRRLMPGDLSDRS